MGVRLPWSDQSDPIWMPKYNGAALTGMQRRGKVRPVGAADVELLARSKNQANQFSINRAGTAPTQAFTPSPILRRILNPESMLPKAVQRWTPKGILGQVDQATGLRTNGQWNAPQPNGHDQAAIYHAAASQGIPLPPHALAFLAHYNRAMTANIPNAGGRRMV